MRWTTNPLGSGQSTSSRQNDCFTPSLSIPFAAETASHAESINSVTLVSSSMTHQSGLLLLRAQDASAAIAFASRFALVCIANFAFGFGAGYLYAQYRNICASEEEDNYAASESDKASVTQEVTTQSEQHSTIVSDSFVEEQHDSFEQATRKFMDSEQCQAEPKSPPGTPLMANDESVATRGALTNPDEQLRASEAPNQGLRNDLDHLNTALKQEGERLVSAGEAKAFEQTADREQGRARVTHLYIQPIHGCPPQTVTSIRLSQLGVDNHLIYAVSDFTGRYISKEKVPQLSEVIATILENGHLRLSAPGLSTLIHEPKFWGQKMKITIHGVQYEAVDQGDAVSQFFANFLEIPGVRFLFIRPPPVSDKGHRLFRTWPTADRPLLLIGEKHEAFDTNDSSAPEGTNVVISAPESHLTSSTCIKIEEHLFEIVKIPCGSASEDDPPSHLLAGREGLVPINLGRNEWVVKKDQVVIIMNSGTNQNP